MSQTETVWLTMTEVIRAHENAGGHFFDDNTKRFFRSRIGDHTYCGPGGIFFTTSEQFSPTTQRRYSVRGFDPANPRSITSVSEFQAFASSEQARRAAKRYAAGKVAP